MTFVFCGHWLHCVFLFTCTGLCSALTLPPPPPPPQPYVPTEEEQMAPLPPNPFSELSERELEDYRKNVERRTLGLPGTAHTPKDTHTQTGGQQKIPPLVSQQSIEGLQTDLINHSCGSWSLGAQRDSLHPAGAVSDM